MFTDGILERINLKENISSDGFKVIDGTIGEYLEHFNNHALDLFLYHATGKFLDLHGLEYGVIRNVDESDVSYRNRIILEKSIVENITDITNLNIQLWVFSNNLKESKSKLTSRNPHLKGLHEGDDVFYASGNDNNKKYILNKFILEDIVWL